MSADIADPNLSAGLTNLMKHFADSGRAVEVDKILPSAQNGYAVRLRFPGATSVASGEENTNFRFTFQLESAGGQARGRFIKAPFTNQLNDLADPVQAVEFAGAIEKRIADTGLIALPQLRAA